MKRCDCCGWSIGPMRHIHGHRVCRSCEENTKQVNSERARYWFEVIVLAIGFGLIVIAAGVLNG